MVQHFDPSRVFLKPKQVTSYPFMFVVFFKAFEKHPARVETSGNYFLH